MIRFWIAGFLMKIGEFFIDKGFEVAGRNGHIEIDFNVNLDEGWPISQWPEWLVIAVFCPIFIPVFWFTIVVLFSA